MKATVIQHVSFEGLGYLQEWLEDNGVTVQLIGLFANDPIPETIDSELLIVLGGPMSANDPLPFLAKERALIRTHVQQNKPMLGICLGAQQLAKAFDADVAASPKEVGWGKIYDNHTKKEYEVLHWHGQGFVPPSGSVPLFHSDYWEHQGFRLANGIGLQFHLETTQTSVAELIENDQDFIKDSVFTQSPEQIRQHQIHSENRQLLFRLLDSLTTHLDPKNHKN